MPRSVLILGGYLVVLGGVLLYRSAVVGLEDGVITEEQVDSQQLEVPAVPQNPVYDSSRCCRDPVFEDANYLFVSTMDGRLHALDANNDGEVAWVADFDTEALMCGTLGKMQPMQVDGRFFNLIPALDGNLYMYSRDEHLLEPIPLSTDILLQASVRVGHDAVAGGRTVTTTGVDPLTGEVRYHCSSSQCDSAVTKPVTTTLVFRRSTSKIRAVDALTGIERWNLSVSEYDATLVKSGKSQLYAARGHRIRYLVQPPDGVITAYDNCGNELWSQQLESHIVRTWRLENGELSEVSLFDADNIHTLSVGNEVTSNAVRRTESLFYLGTLNNEPFIMHSSLVKKEMKRIAKNMDLSEPSSPSSHNQLARPPGSSYLIEQGTVDELLFSSYKRSFTAKQARNNNKQISTRQTRELQVVAANEDSGRVSYPSVSCPSSEGTALIGEKDIRSAAFDGPGGGDQGWFVMRPSGNPAKRDNLFNLLDPSQCNTNIVERFSKTLRVDHMVSGWWRIIALAMLGLVGSASVVLHALLSRRRKRDALSPSLLSSTDSSIVVTLAKAKRAETRSTSVGPSVGSTPSSEETPTGEIRQRRTTSSHDSVGETFHSKFLQDFEPVKLLGHGGFGVVFEAINRLDECPYAVKRIAVSNSERAIQRVLREVRAMAKLDHPSIIRYYHTWIERPPDGWQEQDTLMLHGMASRSPSNELLEELLSQKSLESSSSIIVPNSQVTSEPSQSVEAPAMNEYSDDGSWLDDGNDDGDEADREELSDSDDDESEISAPKPATKEESESVIFATYSSGDASKANTKVDNELAQLGKKMVLVSSTDEDLMPSPVTSNFVYIYIQMQLCQEKTLHMWLSEHRLATDRPLEKMKMWMIQMCSAVSYIHHQGLIHRDMKPQNIFFASDQTLKVGDLGLVTKCVPAEVQPIEKNSSRFAIHTDNVGTRGYMSPEQLANKPYTFKVDVFSLGLIYCELVIPFQTLMERSLTLSSLQHDRVPDSLVAMPEERDFIRWLTCMDPDKRPTCDEILDSDYLAGVESQLSLRSNGLRRRPKSDPKP